MKTIRAWFWGSLAGIALGLIFAPRRTDLLRARAGAQPAQTIQSGATTPTTPTTPLAPGSVVGNRHTHIYHDATDATLPSAENRVYFPNAAAAEAAGYHPAGSMAGAS